jgi:Na+-transporting NADH:ubiquinone oxidoreductase subunit A
MSVHKIRKGLDLPLAGAPAQQIDPAVPVRQVALLGADTFGLRLALAVQPGDRVLRGQLLYEDRTSPGVRWTSPAAGTVRAVNRGDRRAFVSLVIDVADDDSPDAQVAFAAVPPRGASSVKGLAIHTLLLESGLWTALRTRPYSRVPAPGSEPAAIFVTAVDTQPHAPDPQLVLAGRNADFEAGIAALEQLTPGPVLLCRAAGSQIAAGPGSRAQVHEFSGPHPSGTVGLHIHLLHPVYSGGTVWHIGCQDVAAIGHLIRTGRLDVTRVISLAGPAVLRPRLLRTRLGASLAELTSGELQDGDVRVVSGSVLAGRWAVDDAHAFLGRFHHQVSALPEFDPVPRRLLASLRPGGDLFSATRTFVSSMRPGRRLPMTTSSHGPHRPMLPLGCHEQVLPFDLEPVMLLRALLAHDAEQVGLLGGLELDEEDLALATVVCPGKHDYGPLLRQALEHLREIAA